jgi:hypothetical protein
LNPFFLCKQLVLRRTFWRLATRNFVPFGDCQWATGGGMKNR